MPRPHRLPNWGRLAGGRQPCGAKSSASTKSAWSDPLTVLRLKGRRSLERGVGRQQKVLVSAGRQLDWRRWSAAMHALGQAGMDFTTSLQSGDRHGRQWRLRVASTRPNGAPALLHGPGCGSASASCNAGIATLDQYAPVGAEASTVSRKSCGPAPARLLGFSLKVDTGALRPHLHLLRDAGTGAGRIPGRVTATAATRKPRHEVHSPGRAGLTWVDGWPIAHHVSRRQRPRAPRRWMPSTMYWPIWNSASGNDRAGGTSSATAA